MTTQWGLPVFALECRTAARRQTLYAVRALAVAVPFAALTVAWALRPEHDGRPDVTRSLKEYAALGAQFCEAVVGAQLALLMLVAPGAEGTAGLGRRPEPVHAGARPVLLRRRADGARLRPLPGGHARPGGGLCPAGRR